MTLTCMLIEGAIYTGITGILMLIASLVVAVGAVGLHLIFGW